MFHPTHRFHRRGRSHLFGHPAGLVVKIPEEAEIVLFRKLSRSVLRDDDPPGN